MERPDETQYLPLADIEVTAVRPGRGGFVLDGRGADAASYRLEMHLDLPIDPRTRTVLGELLAQSEWRVWRRAGQPMKRPLARRASRRRPAGDADDR